MKCHLDHRTVTKADHRPPCPDGPTAPAGRASAPREPQTGRGRSVLRGVGIRGLVIAVIGHLGAMPVVAGTVSVSFANPETYANADRAGGYSTPVKADSLAEIARHLQRLGEKYLGPNQALSIEVLSIIRSGRFVPSHFALFNVRVYSDILPPSITLRYTLSSAGTIVAEGQDVLTDSNYMTHVGTRSMGSDPLRFEKALLDGWFRARFAEKRSP